MFLASPAVSPAKTEASRPHPNRPYRRVTPPLTPQKLRKQRREVQHQFSGPLQGRAQRGGGVCPRAHSPPSTARRGSAAAPRGSGRRPGRPQCSEDGSPKPDRGRRKQRLRREQAHGQGAGPGWGRHGQWPQPSPVYSVGKREAPLPKAVVKAGAQNEALGREAQAQGGCWKENEPRGSAAGQSPSSSWERGVPQPRRPRRLCPDSSGLCPPGRERLGLNLPTPPTLQE